MKLNIEKYQNTSAHTMASSGQIVAAFDMMIKKIHEAQKALEETNYDKKYKILNGIVESIGLLRAAIDVDTQDPVLKNLDRFWQVTEDRLNRFNIEGCDPKELSNITTTLCKVREAIEQSLKENQL